VVSPRQPRSSSGSGRRQQDAGSVRGYHMFHCSTSLTTATKESCRVGGGACQEAHEGVEVTTEYGQPFPRKDDEGLIQYRLERKVGEGTYGVVYRATEVSTGQIVAVKEMRPDDSEEGVPSSALREIA
ncbi:hypothetical protein VaNZ11_002920, partial [Volvox africanus]